MAAYMLAKMGGNEEPSVADVKEILGSVGAAIDEERIEKVCSELNGKDIDKLIAEGREMVEKDERFHAAVTSGGGVGG
eukprot:CAMPEP_0181319768 /NCGR_PEP_ID=MMETSP1101-20121128/17754_1 /TAXON_ID=46948 /ORGANISM="Rhodomonas abbreviata, Strain Caron Lab Isolate" /LENGTH=77 /DNA_ID=CAMNT_0023427403 /DNA_START=408 /DNA_END=638 /DNA_ORIENTATION=+